MSSTTFLEPLSKSPAAVSRFRPDIEGLRAIAVIAVVVWHAGVPLVPGGFVGVDVFFVISGFLMTGLLYRELRADGRISYVKFLARRVKRLVPASSLALIGTLLAAWIILPPHRLLEVAYDAIASTVYLVNWRLADGSVDYFAQDASASPIQHFWSLSVEEQFYVFWPLLLSLVGLLVAWRILPIRAGVISALTLVFVFSLAWSVYYSESNSGRAYFVTTTRLWELALGGLVAVLLVGAPNFSRVVSAIAAWLGLAGIIAALILFDTALAFPGWVALLPAMGTAAVIAFSPSAGLFGPVPLLSLRPMRWFGSISYSWYLWHWPVIVLGGLVLTDSARNLTVVEGVLLGAASVLPAWLSLKFVEDPLRRARSMNSDTASVFFMGLIASAATLALAMSMATYVRATAPVAEAMNLPPVVSSAVESTELYGAEHLGPDPESSTAGEVADSVASFFPSPSSAASSLPPHQRSGCHANFETSDFTICEYGDRSSDTTVLLSGDSHAAQWASGLIEVAEENGWRLQIATKSACPLNLATFNNPAVGEYVTCTEWNQNALEFLEGPNRPDVLLHSNSAYTVTVDGGASAYVDGGIELIERAGEAGVRVIALRDTPRPTVNVAECVEANMNTLSSCAFERSGALARADQSQLEMVRATGIPLVDASSWICPREQCAPVIGGVLVWRDSNHITNEYSLTLAAPLGQLLSRIGLD